MRSKKNRPADPAADLGGIIIIDFIDMDSDATSEVSKLWKRACAATVLVQSCV